ncbi:MAG: anthranilate phosphoribosyltransferase [SAR202 cluster bacterium]|nr:anthranilate phosphoribosyltransferase [SAR202 cluster bacterium]
MPAITDAIRKLVEGQPLSQQEAAATAEEIMTGQATQAQIGGFLVALRMRGETAEVMAGMAQVMREKATRVLADGDVVDVVGTGGDAMSTFNVSTAASFVVAACGVKVAKHGNRAASGKVGSADILEANGVKIELSPDGVRRCIDEVGIGFMFAQAYHPAMRFAAVPRRELAVRTVFNILGPLTNPAGARYQLIGAPTAEIGEKMAKVLSILGTDRSLVVHGDDGMDELTTTTTSQVWEIFGGRMRHYVVAPEAAGIARCSLADLQVKSADEHKARFFEALGKTACPARDIVLLNAAAALVVAARAADLRAGVDLAREAVTSGAAVVKVRELAKLSQTLA